jgi:glyoxylase-like metal-dependent hydrolase (beta-lactamase superfamily II)/rhodanese-related sulfurtransferase
MADNGSSATEWGVEELHDSLEHGKKFFVFDVRNEDEYESWKIEGRQKIPMVNVPYYEMLEVDEHDDIVDSFVDFLEKGWVEKLPRTEPILAVCAKGDTSEYVAAALRRLDFEAFNLEGGTAAWGDHYHTRPIVETGKLGVYQVSRPARGCLSYMVISDGKAALIDPLRHTDVYLSMAKDKGATIELVLDTHGHADHISGGPALAKALGAPYYLHPYDGIHPIDVMPARIDYRYLEDGQEFEVGDSRLRTMHIPGHTLGNVAYLLDDHYLFTGDSIFIESIARPDLGGRGDTWAPLHFASLGRLLELADDTVILPAHFSGLAEAGDDGLFRSTLGELRTSNEGLRMAQKSEEEFVAYILSSLPKFPEEYVEIKRVNAGLVEVGEAKASELELGKNICALSQAYEEEEA